MRPILQSESSECALACLAMVSAAHKLHVDLDTLRRRFAVSVKGATLQQLMVHAGSTEALYRIRVALDDQTIFSHGQSYALKAGLSLEADVLQERRKVWEWMLEPLLAARAQLKVLGAEPKAASSGS